MFHRLRVLKFSKSFLSDGTNRSIPKKQTQERNAESPERNTSITIKISNKIEEPEISKEIKKPSCVTFNDADENSNGSAASSPMFQRNLTLHKKSLSEKLTWPSKKCNLNNISHRKTFSLFDVKKRMKGKRHQHYKKIKLAFQIFKKDVTKKRSRRTIKRKPEDTNKVVFESSSKEPLQSTAANNVNSNNKLISRRRRKISNASTSYTDMFGFRNKKTISDPKPLYQMGKTDDNIFRKLKRRSATKRKNINEDSKTNNPPHQPFKVVSSLGIGDDSSYYSSRLHYNLVDFSCGPCLNNRIRSKESEILYLPKTKKDAAVCCNRGCKAKKDATVCCNRCCNPPLPERTNVSISCTILEASNADAACGTSKNIEFYKIPCSVSSVPSSKKKYQSNQSKCMLCKKCLKTVSFKQRKPRTNELPCINSSLIRRMQVYSEKIHHKRDIQGRTVLKYFILAIVAVAWTPCVLAIACGWLLTYPLRPHHVMSKSKKCINQEECSSYYSNNNSVWALMVGNMKTAFHKTMSTGNAIKSMLVPVRASKAKSQHINSSPTLINSGPTEIPKHPSPQRRYTLCYNDEKGWVMKPVRQRKRNPARLRVISQTLQNFLYGCSGSSNDVREGADHFTYNATAGTKLNCKRPVSNNSIKSSNTLKLPVASKSKHLELLHKRRSTNRIKTGPHADACRKCCHHRKTYADKKTGGENISRKLELKKPTDTETEICSTELTKHSSPASPKVSHQRRPNMKKAYQRRKSLSEEKKLYPIEPYTQIKETMSFICKKCCKLHYGQSPMSLLNFSSRSRGKRQTGYRETNALLSRQCQPRRSQLRRTPCNSGSIVLVPKRSMSTMSICRPDPQCSNRIPKRSRSESTRSPCCLCKAKGDLERGAFESGKPEGKQPSVLSKKVSFKKDITPSPANEHISIKVKRKKKKVKKRKKETEEEIHRERKTCKIPKPAILLQKIIPATRRKKRLWSTRMRSCCGGCWFSECDRKFRDIIWPMNLECRHLYLYTWKERPCFWVYRRCPNFYPKFVEMYKCVRFCFHQCMICLSLIFWSPFILGAYACYVCCCQMFCGN